ncbi:MAG: hypothetical protein HFG40_03035 [Bacilli bacterium]|nr:hypothetical protein [Bacilli bacterium]
MVRIEVIPNTDILNIADYDEISISAEHGVLFRDFCQKKKLPIDLPYIGGQYWAKEIARLGHIAIMEDRFEICAYANYKLNRYQRNRIVMKKREWQMTNFSGVVVMEDGRTIGFDRELLKQSLYKNKEQLLEEEIVVTNDDVIREFIEKLIPVVERQKIYTNTRRTQLGRK